MCSKQIILVIGLAIGTLNAYCQTFNKYFFIDSIATSAYSMVEKDSFLFVLGVNADISITNGIKTYLAKFDLSGNLLSHVSLRPSQFVYYIAGNQNTLIITHDNGMAATGFALNNYGRDFVSFTKFDSAGNISFYKTYGSSIPQYRHLYAYKLLEYDSSYYLVGSIQLADYSVITILIKIDLSGNLQFFKLYNNLPLWNGPLGFCRLSNGHLLLSCYSQDDLTSVNYWQAVQNTCFVEVDTAGNLMNQNCTTDGNTLAYYTLAISGENYLSSGSYYYDRVQGNGVLQKEYLAKWDSSFNLIWDWKAGGLSDQNSFTDFEQD
ncbi:MAG: hypothetical protein JWO06_242, partial [Bacteroidota bacterium]|nr:hypothetical protein [Bacteroidota bacterium]